MVFAQLEKLADIDYNIFTLIEQRYSPRTFKSEFIKDEHLNKLFESARWSASSNNIQPWRFIYAEKGTASYNCIYECLSDFNKKWAHNAPLLMLTAYKEKGEDGKENFHAMHDLGLSLGMMTMQAQYLGIALHHMAGVNWQKAQEAFEVPEGYHITTAIAVGYYGGDLNKLPSDLQIQETSPRIRMPFNEFAFKERWNDTENIPNT